MAIGPMTGLFLFENTNFFIVIIASAVSCSLGFLIATFIKAPPRLPVIKRVISLDRFLLIEGILPGLTMTCVAIAFGMVMSFTALYGTGLGIKNTGFFFVLQAIGFIASRIISGKYLNKYSYNIGAFGAIADAVFICIMALFPYAPVYFGVAVFLGISFGMNVPAVQNIIVSCAPNNKRGTANSTYLTSFDIGMGIGMLGGGTLSEHFGIPTAFFIGAAFSAIGGVWLFSQRLPP
jgi:predicted MFS family arabinose efflux permease